MSLMAASSDVIKIGYRSSVVEIDTLSNWFELSRSELIRGDVI